jgi:hypothetical protein
MYTIEYKWCKYRPIPGYSTQLISLWQLVEEKVASAVVGFYFKSETKDKKPNGIIDGSNSNKVKFNFKLLIVQVCLECLK